MLRRFPYFSPAISTSTISAAARFSSSSNNHHHALQKTALKQLHKELERDVEEKSGANLPIPPTGWKVTHTPGSCTFQLSTVCNLTDKTKLLDVTHLQDLLGYKTTPPSGSSSTSSSNPLDLQQKYKKWSTKINIFCRFETVDPSFWEPSISICEYVPFRVIMERVQFENQNSNEDFIPNKNRLRSSSSSSSLSSSSSSPLHHPIHSNIMIVDCAHVQSQLRVRRLFFAPSSDRLALEDEASIGLVHGVYAGPEISSRNPSTGEDAATTFATKSASSSPDGYKEKVVTFQKASNQLLTNAAQNNKLISKELNSSIMEMLSNVGVDSRLGEFICQMGYCFEHEEYELWLAKLADFGGRSGNDDELLKNGKNKNKNDDDDDGQSSNSVSLEETAKNIFREDYDSKMIKKKKKSYDRDDDVHDYESEIENDKKMREVSSRMSSFLNKVKGNPTVVTTSGNSATESKSSISSVTGKSRKSSVGVLGGSTQRRR